MYAEHLEGADECTVGALLSCVQDCVTSSKKPTEDFKNEQGRRCFAPSHNFTAAKQVPKPIQNPKATSWCHVLLPLIPLSGATIVSPPIPSNELEVVLTDSVVIPSGTIHASFGSHLNSSGQREATDVCAVDSGHVDVDIKCTGDLTSGNDYFSKRSLRKQILHPRLDECYEDSGLNDSKVDFFSGGVHASKSSLQKQALRSKRAAEGTGSTPGSPETAATPKPKRPPMPCMRPQQCSVCQEVVCNNHMLKTHMRIHTGERPYSCPMCPQKCTTSNNLIIHKRTHTGEKPYSCKVCHRKFSQYQNMHTHMRTHTGEKPFACNFCEKRFAHRKNLRQHLVLHVGE